jgi:hypothetical protein
MRLLVLSARSADVRGHSAEVHDGMPLALIGILVSTFNGLCTKNPVRNLTHRSIRTFWSHSDDF